MLSERKTLSALIGTCVAVVIGALVAWAGSYQGAKVGAMPVFALAVSLVFVVQWLAFVPSYLLHTERFYDLVGAVTSISAITVAVVLAGASDARSLMLLVLVVVWAGRLGAYLYRRVRRTGRDDRFDQIKQSFSRFLMTWTLQGLWISLTLAAALAAVTSNEPKSLDVLAYVGLGVWIAGISIEMIADLQKSRFRQDPANSDLFIQSGLWSISRHPNYFGEITLWVGVALISLPVLQGWQFATLISPVFVWLLITRVSGVPMLEKKAEARWGHLSSYQEYKHRTPLLVPYFGLLRRKRH